MSLIALFSKCPRKLPAFWSMTWCLWTATSSTCSYNLLSSNKAYSWSLFVRGAFSMTILWIKTNIYIIEMAILIFLLYQYCYSMGKKSMTSVIKKELWPEEERKGHLRLLFVTCIFLADHLLHVIMCRLSAIIWLWQSWRKLRFCVDLELKLTHFTTSIVRFYFYISWNCDPDGKHCTSLSAFSDNSDLLGEPDKAQCKRHSQFSTALVIVRFLFYLILLTEVPLTI